jgi:hypothetical protein
MKNQKTNKELEKEISILEHDIRELNTKDTLNKKILKLKQIKLELREKNIFESIIYNTFEKIKTMIKKKEK